MSSPLDELNRILNDDLVKVNDLIAEKMQSENAPRIKQVSEHLVGSGGKRVRPMLTCAAARLVGYEGAHHISLSASVEFIHTATLLHDDVVDEAKLRRGKKPANLLWDNKSSVLVGDYLFSRAFQLMVETQNLRVLDILANASAVIAEGEVLQLMVANDLTTTKETYFKVIEGKTAALFAAACSAGAVIGDASEEQVLALFTYGLKIGLAFQIADDILDYVGDKEFGKAIGNDFSERKMTLPVIFALENAQDDEWQFWGRTIAQGKQEDQDLAQALRYIEKHNAIGRSRALASELVEEAKSELQIFAQSPLQTALLELADYVISRAI